MKIGFGYDIHKLVSGKCVILGGVEIPCSKSLLGHSDGDVLIHSVCDALLGCAGSADIGTHFPDTDKKYKGVSSIIFLKEVKLMLDKAGYKISNIDATVVAEMPRLEAHKITIRNNIAGILNIKESKINIKASTNEAIGQIGKNLAIASYCVALVE